MYISNRSGILLQAIAPAGRYVYSKHGNSLSPKAPAGRHVYSLKCRVWKLDLQDYSSNLRYDNLNCQLSEKGVHLVELGTTIVVPNNSLFT